MNFSFITLPLAVLATARQGNGRKCRYEGRVAVAYCVKIGFS